ncbi:MAG: cyclic nucleotide-binding domain-containing protein [Flavobacteriales bacterium]|nr:cyclic nucleotide-binding domain-containing protein [Flavobacteriales bacterium]
MSKATNYTNTLSSDLINQIKSIALNNSFINEGDLLFREGDKKEFVYLIEKGEVIIVKDHNQQKFEVINQHEGEIVGIDLIFNENECEYSAIASEPTKLYKVLISDFKNFLSRNNNTSIELLKYISALVNKMESQAINNSI